MLQSSLMDNSHFPSANKFIIKFCKTHSELNSVITAFEASLKKNEELNKIQEQLKPLVDNLHIDLMLLQEAATTLQEERAQIVTSLRLLQICYGQLIEIDGLITDGKVQNISRYTLLCKQNEVLQELKHIEEHQKAAATRNVGMENRQIVIHFRSSQNQLAAANNELLSIQKEVEYVVRQWKLKLERAIKHRNKKIVAVVTYAQLTMHLTKELTSSEANCLSVTAKEPHQPPQTGQRRQSHQFVLQSALDFFTSYPEKHTATEIRSDHATDSTKTAKTADQLRSILTSNRREKDKSTSDGDLSGVKQVQFAQEPTYHHYIKDDDSSRLSDALFQAVASKMQHPKDASVTQLYPEKPQVLSMEIVSDPLDISSMSSSGNKLTFEHLFGSVLANRTEKSVTRSVNKSDVNMKSLKQAEEDAILSHDSFDNLHFSEQPCDVDNDFFLDFSNETSNNESHF